MLTDQTRAFGEKVQHAAHEFAQTASSAMADVGRRAGEASEHRCRRHLARGAVVEKAKGGGVVG